MEFYKFEVERLDGTQESMEKYKGKTIVVVNTASKCGLTPPI
jgi:glutathione peroxidase